MSPVDLLILCDRIVTHIDEVIQILVNLRLVLLIFARTIREQEISKVNPSALDANKD